MTTISDTEPAAAVTTPARDKRGLGLRRVRWWRVVVLGVLAVYFLVPLASTFWFTLYTPGTHTFSLAPYGQMFSAQGFGTSVRMTVEIALVTIVILYLLLVPAMIAVQLRLPKLKPVLESLAMVPLVLSPVALVVGVQTVLGWGLDQDPGTPLFQLAADLQNQSFPLILPIVYVVIALPFAYRSLESGLRSVDLKTLVEASRGLGASWPVTIWRAVLPNLRSGLLSGAILTLALVFGEYTISSILQFLPFSVWIVQDGQGATSGQLAPAVSLLSLLLSWAVLFLVSFLGGRRAVGRPDRSS
ncbi:ABC transporter permease subunit [Actinospica sp. MGRD01-02]|uniref:ABC transporter permease subunit n=1 Tax=Actinospica acidithermotolerans TaxID=2828514 RepID=A0A941IKB7_9ACTN|nr:ABC transporter permease subunit [Actinospica acidithermotolerans]MBR7830384.1 ABC transporter permease subunit [Actinospica acidithermotolerans]